MNAWTAQFKKELHLGGFRLMPAMELIAMLLGILGAWRWNSPDIALMIGVFLVFLHLFYLLVFLVTNVFAERKTFHLWLHNPLAGWQLLLAKLAAGIVSMLVSYALAGVYTWICFLVSQSVRKMPGNYPIYRMALIATFDIFEFAVVLTVIFIFFWILFLRIYSWIGNWSWPISGGILLGSFYLLAYLEKISFIRSLTHWGKIILLNEHLAAHFSAWSVIYLGDQLSTIVILLVFFLAASWLLDHRVDMV
ncbi:MAG: hypothetical protein ABF820_03265 [Sporolactobacillus sp.]